jgi:hypothetical protein
MKIYMLLIVLSLFIGCKHFESRHSTGSGTGVICRPECTPENIDELADPIF